MPISSCFVIFVLPFSPFSLSSLLLPNYDFFILLLIEEYIFPLSFVTVL